MSTSYVARQAIYDGGLATVAYELLFRSAAAAAAADFADADAASASTVLTGLYDIGLDTLVGETRAFVNASRGFLVDGGIRACPADRVVVEVLEDVPFDDEVVEALRRLAADGYVIALDDFVYDGGSDGADTVLDLASIVKIEVLNRSDEQLESQLEKLRRFPGLELLAEKVETVEDFERCQRLGFTMFQGYFFSRPQVHEGRAIGPDRMSRLQLIATLQDPSVDQNELVDLVSRDLGLSHRLLTFVNSAHFALSRHVDSVRTAISLIGHRQLRLFASLVVMGGSTDRPREMLLTALVRARMCEVLAPRVGVDPDAAFTAGLFSAADALLDVAMLDVVDQLPFNDEMKAALTRGEGRLGQLVTTVLLYEDGLLTAPVGGVPFETCESAYVEALTWAATSGALTGAAA